ncbi:MAG: AMP-binding protein, partial [Actinobacteria bacterium]|nr:AMP-binding protein [Actinomycetota bacterium]
MVTRDWITDAATLWELVARRAGADPDGVALVDEQERQLTLSGLRDRAETVAAGLYRFGLREASAVSWQLPSRIDTVVLSLALARLGVVQNPIIHLYREREVAFALRQTGASMFVVPGMWRGFDYTDLAERVTAGLDPSPRVLVLDDGLPEGDPSVLPPAPEVQPGCDAPVRWIYYTSGSTADPKGVQHTDQTLMAAGRGLAYALDMSADDIGSIAFPYAHIAGPDYLVMVLTVGMSTVIVEAFSMDVLPFFRKHGVTMVGGSTAFYVAYLAEQRKDPSDPILPTLRLMTGGGAPKPPEIHYEVQREIGGRGVVHGYGMTEVPMIANGSPHDTDEQLANTDGAPIRDAEVRVVKLDGGLAGPDEEGELRVRGPMVMRGYTDPKLNDEAFDDAGYFRTGDLGKLRADGHVVLTGRLKDVIIRKGENVSAKEIED